MWVERLDVRGFRRLAGAAFEFGPGLNVVVGSNEAGKSSLHEALVRALFGFERSERRKLPSEGRAEKDRFQPWAVSHYGLTVELAAVHGRRVRAEWDFATHAVVVRDSVTGEDLTVEVLEARDEVALGPWLLGVGLREFRQTCCLDQGDLAPLTDTGGLLAALQRAVDTGDEDGGVDDAVGRLDDFLRVIGVNVRHGTSTREGRLAAAVAERDALAAELARAAEREEESAALAREIDETRAALDTHARCAERLRRGLLLRAVASLSDRVERARELAARAEVPAPEAGPLDVELSAAVDASASRLEHAERRLAEVAIEAERSAADVAELEARERVLGAEVDRLAAHRDVDTSSEHAVRELQARLAELDALPDATAVPVPNPDPALRGYRAERAELAALAVPAPAGILQLLVAVLTFGVAAWLRRRRQARRASDLAARLAAYDACSLEALDVRCRAEEIAIESARLAIARAAEEHAAARAKRDALAAELETVLAAHGWSGDAPGYLAACERRARLRALEHELVVHREQRLAASAPARETRDRRAEVAALRAELAASYAALGIDGTDLLAAAACLAERRAADARHGRACAAAGEAQAALAALLGGATLDELVARREEARTKLLAHETQRGPLEPLDGAAADLERESDEARRLDVRLAELSGRLAEQETGQRAPAEIQEGLDRATAAAARLEAARDAVILARDELRDAAAEARRTVAPRLQEALVRTLPRLTGGRYTRATVAEDLTVLVEAPETGQLVRVGDLSSGTQSQVHLVQRLTLAALLDPTTGAAPLLLDDPFARWDARRIAAALELVAELAAERQVIVFSDDPGLADAARELADAARVIDLAELAQPASIAARSDAT